MPFLSPDDAAALEEIVKALEFKDINPTRRVIALRGRTVAQLTHSLNLNDLEQRCLAVCINMGHGGLMRGLEITQRHTKEDCGSIVADFQPMADDKSTTYFRIELRRTERGTSFNQFWALAAKHGINPNLVGNHSLRSGGATDLF